MHKLALFEHNQKPIYNEDFRHALRLCHVQPGDTLLVHSDIGVFGKLMLFDRALLCQAFVDIFLNSIGPSGTLIMPTFTYSFCNAQIYDSDNTPSQVGILTEYFRHLPKVLRTDHPIFSMAITGRLKEFYHHIDSDSFGWQSVFGKLHSSGGKLVFLGTSLKACTYIHHIEQIYGVPYRYLKIFEGVVKKDTSTHSATASFFVRYLDKNVALDLSKLQNHLIAKNLLKQALIGNADILVIDAKVLFNETIALLDKDPHFLLKEPFLS